MPNRHPFANIVFAFSALCLVLALFVALMLALDPGSLAESFRRQYLPAAGVLLAGLGFSGTIMGLGCLLERQPGRSRAWGSAGTGAAQRRERSDLSGRSNARADRSHG